MIWLVAIYLACRKFVTIHLANGLFGLSHFMWLSQFAWFDTMLLICHNSFGLPQCKWLVAIYLVCHIYLACQHAFGSPQFNWFVAIYVVVAICSACRVAMHLVCHNCVVGLPQINWVVAIYLACRRFVTIHLALGLFGLSKFMWLSQFVGLAPYICHNSFGLPQCKWLVAL